MNDNELMRESRTPTLDFTLMLCLAAERKCTKRKNGRKGNKKKNIVLLYCLEENKILSFSQPPNNDYNFTM